MENNHYKAIKLRFPNNFLGENLCMRNISICKLDVQETMVVIWKWNQFLPASLIFKLFRELQKLSPHTKI